MTTVGIVGPGRAGTLVGVACARAGFRIAVAGGRQAARAALVDLVAGTRSLDRVTDLAGRCETIVLAVPDAAVAGAADELAMTGALREHDRVVHLAGSLGLDPLRRAALAGADVAACHPAMTIPSGATDPSVLHGVRWAVTAGPADRAWAHELVARLGGDAVDVADDVRTLYHAGLVLASNAVGAAVAAARRLLLAAGIDEPAGFLEPLARASVANVAQQGASALTGPVVRGDVATLEAHLAALRTELPELEDAYRHLTQVIVDQARLGLDGETLAAFDALLDDEGSR